MNLGVIRAVVFDADVGTLFIKGEDVSQGGRQFCQVDVLADLPAEILVSCQEVPLESSGG